MKKFRSLAIKFKDLYRIYESIDNVIVWNKEKKKLDFESLNNLRKILKIRIGDYNSSPKLFKYVPYYEDFIYDNNTELISQDFKILLSSTLIPKYIHYDPDLPDDDNNIFYKLIKIRPDPNNFEMNNSLRYVDKKSLLWLKNCCINYKFERCIIKNYDKIGSFLDHIFGYLFSDVMYYSYLFGKPLKDYDEISFKNIRIFDDQVEDKISYLNLPIYDFTPTINFSITMSQGVLNYLANISL